MSLPRMVVDGRTSLITRRCVEQRYLTRPDRPAKPGGDGEGKRIDLYCIGHAALETGVKLHAFVLMSNHSHVVATDPASERPSFAGRFHGLFARILNAKLGRKSNLWDGSCSYNDLHCVEPEDVLDRMVYVTTNPVAAGLVERPEDWPGAITLPEHYLEGWTFVAPRPGHLLRTQGRGKKARRAETARDRARGHCKPKDPLPVEREFALTIPAPFRWMGRAAFVALYRDRVNTRLEQLRDARERQADRRKRNVLGVQAIFDTPLNDAPKKKSEAELVAAREKRLDDGLVPNLACKDPLFRVLHKLALGLFWKENRRCYEAFREGKRGTVFPAGTWGAARLYGARVDDAG